MANMEAPTPHKHTNGCKDEVASIYEEDSAQQPLNVYTNSSWGGVDCSLAKKLTKCFLFCSGYEAEYAMWTLETVVVALNICSAFPLILFHSSSSLNDRRQCS